VRATHVNDTVHIASPQVKHMIGSRAKDNLRYRLLHVAARITRSGRRTRLRIAENWPWATDLVNAFTRLAALPRPIT
jgi:hypothetical protein